MLDNAITLGDVETEALRSLMSCRGLSKGGLAVNATTNTHTLTIGTKQTDDIITVTIVTEAGTVTDDYTVLAGDADEAAVATALELLIEALVGVASSAVGAVITITPATTTEVLSVTATVTKAVGEPTTTATVAETIIGAKGIKTASTINYLMNGHCGQKAATNNIALTGDVLPVSSFRWYLITLDADGTFLATPNTDNVNLLPDIPANKAPVGALKIATSAAVTFTPGTTGLNATGITDTYFDLSCIPKAGYPA